MNRGEVAALKQFDVVLDELGREVTVLYVEETGPNPPELLVRWRNMQYLLMWTQVKKFVRAGG